MIAITDLSYAQLVKIFDNIDSPKDFIALSGVSARMRSVYEQYGFDTLRRDPSRLGGLGLSPDMLGRFIPHLTDHFMREVVLLWLTKADQFLHFAPKLNHASLIKIRWSFSGRSLRGQFQLCGVLAYYLQGYYAQIARSPSAASELSRAGHAGFLDLVRDLLRAGISPLAPLAEGVTVIASAAASVKRVYFKILFEAVVNDDRVSVAAVLQDCINYAARQGFTGAAAVAPSVDPMSYRLRPRIPASQGSWDRLCAHPLAHDLDLNPSLLYGAYRGDAHLVMKCLGSGQASLRSKDLLGRTPFWIAVNEGRLALVEKIWACIPRDKVPLNEPAFDGNTPLMVAVEKGHYALCAILLSSLELDLNAKRYLDKKTALMIAMESNNKPMVNLLMSTHRLVLPPRDPPGKITVQYRSQAPHYSASEIIRSASHLPSDHPLTPEELYRKNLADLFKKLPEIQAFLSKHPATARITLRTNDLNVQGVHRLATYVLLFEASIKADKLDEFMAHHRWCYEATVSSLQEWARNLGILFESIHTKQRTYFKPQK